jgi:hypothetical protein
MKKFESGLLKVAVLAWGVPVLIVAVSWWAAPDPNRAKDSFPHLTFVPSEISVIRKKERKNEDYFELWLTHPNGTAYFFRDPEPEPVQDLADIIPRNQPLRVVYETGREGNILMEIASADAAAKPYLAFEEVMAEYASRRRLVVTVAAIWFVVGNTFLFLLWRIAKARPHLNDNPVN